MTEKYEFIFLTAPDMTKERRQDFFKELEDKIKKTKAEVDEKEKWGEKKLVYPMKKNKTADFWVWNLVFSGTGFDFSPLTTYLNRQDDVLRYLLLKNKGGN